MNLICNKFNYKKNLVRDFNFSHIDWGSVQGNSSSFFTSNKFVDIFQKNF